MTILRRKKTIFDMKMTIFAIKMTYLSLIMCSKKEFWKRNWSFKHKNCHLCPKNRLEVVPKTTFYSDYAMIGVWDRSRLILSAHPYLGLYSLPPYCSAGKF